MINNIEALQSAKMDVYDARSLTREYLRIIENQVELIAMSMKKGNTTFIADGLELLRSYLSSEHEHICILADDAKKDWDKIRLLATKGGN